MKRKDLHVGKRTPYGSGAGFDNGQQNRRATRPSFCARQNKKNDGPYTATE